MNSIFPNVKGLSYFNCRFYSTKLGWNNFNIFNFVFKLSPSFLFGSHCARSAYVGRARRAPGRWHVFTTGLHARLAKWLNLATGCQAVIQNIIPGAGGWLSGVFCQHSGPTLWLRCQPAEGTKAGRGRAGLTSHSRGREGNTVSIHVTNVSFAVKLDVCMQKCGLQSYYGNIKGQHKIHEAKPKEL